MYYWLKVFLLVGMFTALCVKGAEMLSASGVHAMSKGQAHLPVLKDPSPAKLLSPDPSSPAASDESAQKLISPHGGKSDKSPSLPLSSKTFKPKTNLRKSLSLSTKPAPKVLIKKK